MTFLSSDHFETLVSQQISNGASPSPLQNEFDVIDVSINSGHPEFNERCAFNGEFEKAYQGISSSVSTLSPCFELCPYESSHITLLTPFNGSRDQFETLDKSGFLDLLSKIQSIVTKHIPIQAKVLDLAMGGNGSIFFLVESKAIQDMRSTSEEIAKDTPYHLVSRNIIHITVARLTKAIAFDEFQRVHHLVQSFRKDFRPIELNLESSNLVVALDLFSTKYDHELMERLSCHKESA